LDLSFILGTVFVCIHQVADVIRGRYHVQEGGCVRAAAAGRGHDVADVDLHFWPDGQGFFVGTPGVAVVLRSDKSCIFFIKHVALEADGDLDLLVIIVIDGIVVYNRDSVLSPPYTEHLALPLAFTLST
jgi:hypothetical protein